MDSYASDPSPPPVARAIARSMFSLGIEYDRALAIAVASGAFDSGSGPPSFAATMMPRVSFVNSLPRFASSAPFLRLMVDHLEWPLMPPPPGAPGPPSRRTAHAAVGRASARDGTPSPGRRPGGRRRDGLRARRAPRRPPPPARSRAPG